MTTIDIQSPSWTPATSAALSKEAPSTSWVWRYFIILDKTTTQCQIPGCHRVIVKNTTTMGRHLNSHKIFKPLTDEETLITPHPELQEHSPGQVSKRARITPSSSMDKMDQDEFDDLEEAEEQDEMEEEVKEEPEPEINVEYQEFKNKESRILRELDLQKSRKRDAESKIETLFQQLVYERVQYQVKCSLKEESTAIAVPAMPVPVQPVSKTVVPRQDSVETIVAPIPVQPCETFTTQVTEIPSLLELPDVMGVKYKETPSQFLVVDKVDQY